MKAKFPLVIATLAFLFTTSIPMSAETWYVRSDGGTRYSAKTHRGQCDGKADAPYPGGGVDRHCAYGDIRYLWSDGSYQTSASAGAPGWGWVIAGGDTVVIRGGPWRVGWSNNSNAKDGELGIFTGLAGDPYSSGAPPIPSGTFSHHTRILGACAVSANCSSGNNTIRRHLTQLFGGFGVTSVLNLSGTRYLV